MVDRGVTTNVGVRDVPIEGFDEDERGLKIGDYARALSEFILRTETPITVGIQGDWGSGKTSLMQLICRQIEPTPPAKPKAPTVWVNTWKYAQTATGDALAIAVFLGILHQLRRKTGVGKGGELFKRLGAALGTLGGRFLDSHLGLDIAGALKKGDVDAIFEQYEALDGLKQELTRLVDDVVQHERTPGDRVVVFVDDLDRVLPERAVEILEVLKIFLDIPGLVFLLACDYDVIVQGLRARAGLGGEQVSGRSFFDKIIQVPFQMPSHSPERLHNYLSALFARVNAPIRAIEDQDRMVRVLHLTTGTNPRTIKRLVNILNLLLIVLDSEKHTWDDRVANKPLIVFTLVALQNAFPEVYAYLSGRSDGEIFDSLSEELFADVRGLARARERRPDLSVDDLNELLGILRDLTGGDGALLGQFLRVSDMAAVPEPQETRVAAQPSGPTRFARNYIEQQPPEYRDLIRRLFEGLPGGVEYHKSGDYLWLCPAGDQNTVVHVRRKPLGRMVDVIFNVDSSWRISDEHEETYYDRLQAAGCPRPQSRYRDFPSDNFIACSLAKQSTEEEIVAVRDFLRWYLLGVDAAE